MNVVVSIHAIVPMKPAYQSKSRLADMMDADDRAALSLHLLQHVLHAISGAAVPVQTSVIGGDDWIREVALQAGASWQDDPGGGLNGAIRYAVDAAFAATADAVLVVPGDLGLLTVQDIDDLTVLSSGLQRLILARAASDGGTNAIFAPRGMMVGPHFGHDSFKKHLQAAQDSSIPVEISQSQGFAFDLDTPQDLETYRAASPGLDAALAAWRQKLSAKSQAPTG